MTSANDISDYSVIASDVYNENQDDETGKSQAHDKIKSKEYKTNTLTLERKIYQKFDNDIDVSVYFRESKSQSGETLPEIVVSFGGTNGATDFLSDLRRGFNPYNPEMEKIRSSVRNEILEIEKKHEIKDIKVTSVGHSLGGCYAELFAASFYGDEKEDSGKRVNVMTFNGFGAALGLRDYNNFAKKR